MKMKLTLLIGVLLCGASFSCAPDECVGASCDAANTNTNTNTNENENKNGNNNETVCGDAQLDQGEVCDGTELDGRSCASEGFAAGSLACRADCLAFDTSGCWPTFVDRGIVLENEHFVEGFGEIVSVASDPSVVRSADGFRMIYTCINYAEADPPRTIFCAATSPDGLVWNPDPGPYGGAVLEGAGATEQARIESSEIVAAQSDFVLFYSSYSDDPHSELGVLGYPAELHRVLSTDAASFSLASGVALSRTANGYDADAIYSPTVLKRDDDWLMVYSAHCFPRAGTSCDGGGGPGGVTLATATATSLEGSWVKSGTLSVANCGTWCGAFVAEADLVTVNDFDYLFFSAFNVDEKPVAIGMARAAQGTLAFEAYPQPLVTAADVGALHVVAPEAVVHDGQLFVWYTWIDPTDTLARIALLTAEL